MTLKFYHDLMTQPSRALYMFFNAAGIPYEGTCVSLRRNEQLKPEFAAVSPMKKIPVLVHERSDGSKRLVVESCAIARYAATQFLPASSHWWPRDDVRKSLRVDEYLHWQHLNVRTNGTLVFLHSILNPLRFKQPPNMSQIHHFNIELGKNADVMETHFLDGGKKFIAGDEISVADLFALCELTQPMCAGFDVTATRPRLSTWMKDVIHVTKSEFVAAHVENDKFRERFQESVQGAYRDFLSKDERNREIGKS